MTTPIVQSISDERLDEIEAEAAATINAPLTNPWRFGGLETASVVFAIIARLRDADEKIDALLSHCPDSECEECSRIICDHGDQMHFHDDGCPSCWPRPKDAATERKP